MDLNKGHTRLIIDECKKHGLLRNQAAYVLATAYHETAHTMKPVREMGGEKYLRSKPYYPYVGMGFVQLTWKRNYEHASKKLGADFVSNPKELLRPDYSAAILVIGMKEGWFAGDKTGRHKLDRYITLSKSDWRNARRIVNGMDKATLIAGYALEYDMALKAEGYGEGKPAGARSNTSAPTKPAPTVATKPTATPEPKRGLLAIILEIIMKLFGAKK
jgi:hypothetical protein